MREAAWAPVLVFVAHAIGARVFGHEPYVDPVMHFLGGAATAFFVYRVCRIGGGLIGAPSILVVDLLAVGLTCAVALAWELGELVSDVTLGTRAHTSVANTLRDLLLGAVGAVATAGASHLLPSGGEGVSARDTGERE